MPCRALGSCSVWQLNISDIDPLLHIQPSLGDDFYAAFKANLMRSMADLPLEQQEQMWWAPVLTPVTPRCVPCTSHAESQYFPCH